MGRLTRSERRVGVGGARCAEGRRGTDGDGSAHGALPRPACIGWIVAARFCSLEGWKRVLSMHA